MKKIIKKLEEFKHLKKNWDGDDGDPISKENIENLEIILKMIYASKPEIFCFCDGVLAEWEDEEGNYFEIEARNNGKTNVGIYFDKEKDEKYIRKLLKERKYDKTNKKIL